MSSQIIKRCFIFGMLFLTACSSLTQLRLDVADKLFADKPLDAPAELTEIKATNVVKLNWSSQLGETERYDFTPAMSAGFVFMANANGDLIKKNVETGKEEWRASVGEPISGGVGAGGGIVMVGSSRGNVFAYDFSGKQLWKSHLSSEVLSVPRYFDGKAIVRSGDDYIYGLDAADGSRKWVYSRKLPALSLRSSAGIVVDGGAVYAGFAGGKMVALNADSGKLLWEATVAVPKGVTEIERIADITSSPVVNGPVVYAVAYQGRIAAIDRRNGQVLWNREISSYSGLSYGNDKLYVSHALGSLYALDHATGRTFWRQGDLLHRNLTTPLWMKNFVAVGDLEGYVHFIHLENGQFAARIKVDSQPIMSLIAGNTPSQLIAASRNGGLYALTIEESTTAAVDTSSPAQSQVKGELADGAEVDAQSSEIMSNQNEEASRSIMFQNQKSILLPDNLEGGNGPGIILPKSE